MWYCLRKFKNEHTHTELKGKALNAVGGSLWGGMMASDGCGKRNLMRNTLLSLFLQTFMELVKKI